MQKPILYLILCLAALVRLYNLDHGLPEIYEEATPMRQAWEIWRGADGGLDFNPHFFNYPAFYFYLQFFGQAVYFVLNLLIGRLHALEDMYQLYESDPTEIVLIARFVNISFGLGSVWATYRLGCMLHNRQVGLFASAILALAPIPVRTSRIILVDTPLLFFGTLSLIQCMQVFKENKLSDNLWAGAWIGLASACKYTGTLFIIPFLTAHILRNRSLHSLLHQKKRIAAGLLFAAFIFFSPIPISFSISAPFGQISHLSAHIWLWGILASTQIERLQPISRIYGTILVSPLYPFSYGVSSLSGNLPTLIYMKFLSLHSPPFILCSYPLGL
jgi:hypothetical protein